MFVEPPANLEGITSEAAFQTLVVDALRRMGWVVIEMKDTRTIEVGIPDLLCFRENRGQMIELKIGKRPLSAGQKRWRERRVPPGTIVPTIHNTTEEWNALMEIST